jgi:hypothetical protein
MEELQEKHKENIQKQLKEYQDNTNKKNFRRLRKNYMRSERTSADSKMKLKKL